MLTLLAKIRQISGKKTKTLRKKGILPAILYGPKIKSSSLEVDSKEFEKIYQEAGESSLVSLEVEGKKIPVLIHEIQRDPLTDKILHIDFYQAPLEEKITAKIPLIFEGFSPAVKELGGTLVKVIHELEVKAKPEDLPKEIKVDISSLKIFEDILTIKDLKVPIGVEILKNPEEIVAEVFPPEKVEEELAKPVEEKVEEVEKVEEKAEEKEETRSES
ncbi:MAG: 50S ribosomal protein L25 [Candidatus Nealsonbacteria bacterium CG23_combo_of_CG06-09_8_20_14_all_36_12]|uniref:Large ribosomal subunit protein bL25 n=2 Tax=Candidatus Nealsoniibacteriota TaxID=1817911 RepID=A0A2H0TKS8_9BACT|nr:MAG: 50S ribosomal protein L25 [Candidatus Nealsonbacteria bacterium CG23_combo_of_CG06-09_8_20_14_all_36_12]PIR72753.1 MAG: 50S ribosomal protein L25 [Candidatus Nealsonbacteria bacterium CG10_big_fil_rev_8_21_14_0_10_36_23]